MSSKNSRKNDLLRKLHASVPNPYVDTLNAYIDILIDENRLRVDGITKEELPNLQGRIAQLLELQSNLKPRQKHYQADGAYG